MENGQIQVDNTLSTIEEIEEGHALYAEVSESVFWVKQITVEYISLKNTDGEIRNIARDAFQTSLHEHNWILQAKGPAVPLSEDEHFKTYLSTRIETAWESFATSSETQIPFGYPYGWQISSITTRAKTLFEHLYSYSTTQFARSTR